MAHQIFIDTQTQQWINIELFPGTQILPLAEPVPQSSIHKLRMAADTVIPVHYHPYDEYVYAVPLRGSKLRVVFPLGEG
ncbi:hypothetical protein [Dendronalium sp. ChiSLP03b]|uniref:hypothetical protein n=1 Tax=Dendronalium sp. ChiSLP03b TaxID=3075381 RepID=UPI002AD412E1|nr:hypothetical protein [Dendronalium sp. ChiSLP03b]MDZ8208681.1 hypothetical protein [Dendronalium sp. ChiSLP03b]